MADRQLKVTIVGEDKGGAKTLGGLKKAGDDLVPSLGKAEKALGSVTQALSSHLPVGGAQAKAALDKVSGSLVSGAKEMGTFGTAVVAGSAVAGAALLKFASDGVGAFVSATAETRKLKAAMGSTAEEASMLRNVGKSLGVDVDTLAKGFVNFDKKLADSKDVLASYGAQVVTNKQGHIDQFATLLNLGDAYKKIQDPVERNIFLTTAFGKAGAELRPILSANREELEKFAKAGVIFNDDQLLKGKEFTLAQRNLNLELEKLKINLGSAVVPQITQLTTNTAKAVDWIDRASKSVGGLGGVFSAALKEANPLSAEMDFLADKHKTVGDAAVALGKSFAGPFKFGLELAAQWHHKGGDAAKEQADQFSALADIVSEDTGITDQNALAQIRSAKSLKEANDAANAAAKAYYAMFDAQVRVVGDTLSLEDAQIRVKKSEQDVKDATKELTDAIRDHGRDSTEARDATDKLADAQRGLTRDNVALAQQTVSMRIDQLAATGVTVDASQKADLLKQALQQLAANVKDPLRSELLALAGDIKGLPDNKRIKLEMDTTEARAALQSFIIDAQNDLIRAHLANVNTAAYKAAEGYGGGYSEGPSGAGNNDTRPLEGSGSSDSGGPGYAGDSGYGGLERYDLGGWVKGPKGQPRLAIVHGGEYVVTADEAGGAMSGGTSAPGGSGGSGGAVATLINRIVINDRVLAEELRTIRIRDGLLGLE